MTFPDEAHRAWSAIACQLILLIYHQTTTLFNFFPFNGSRNYTKKEKLAEVIGNGVMMALGPIGFAFHIRPLMAWGLWYYFILFGIELLIWWVPYVSEPAGAWRWIYNRLLGVFTSNFEPGDTLTKWKDIYQRLHRDTIMIVPDRAGRIVPNLEHTILHAWTLVTAIVTVWAYFHR